MEGIENIRLKLLADNNVILLKCAGFDTEIFMPSIIDGRLSLINVVPQRRTCKCISTNLIVGKRVNRLCETNTNTISNWHLSRDFSSVCETSTPDQVRCTSIIQRPAISRMLQFDNITTSPDQQKNLHPLDKSSAIQTQLHVLTEINSKSATPGLTEITSPPKSATPHGSLSNIEWPQISFVDEENEENCLFLPSNSQDLPRWREKVLTPIRTYSRKKYTPSHKNNKARSNVLIKHTEGIKPQKSVINRQQKSHTIIDESIRISPKSFKRQFVYKGAQELYRETCQEHKDRENEIARKTAYELFTTHALQSCFSQKLKAQYHTRCQNKAVSTYPKYKNLAKVETLSRTQND